MCARETLELIFLHTNRSSSGECVLEKSNENMKNVANFTYTRTQFSHRRFAVDDTDFDRLDDDVIRKDATSIERKTSDANFQSFFLYFRPLNVKQSYYLLEFVIRCTQLWWGS